MRDKPTYEYYYKDGSIKFQSWLKNDRQHRPNGLPACIWYYENGNIEYQEWYENGIELSPKEVLQRQHQWFYKIINIIDKKGIGL